MKTDKKKALLIQRLRRLYSQGDREFNTGAAADALLNYLDDPAINAAYHNMEWRQQ